MAFILCSCASFSPTFGPKDNYCNYFEDVDTNMYKEIIENKFIKTATENKSNFSLSSSTAAYTNIKNMIFEENCIPNKDAVLIDQMINYFDYDYKLQDGEKIGIFNEVADCPWNEDHFLASIAVKAKEIDETERKNMNVVFLIDTSGSMSSYINMMKTAFEKLTNKMSDEDRISIVTYSTQVETILDGASGKDKNRILGKINTLSAGGGTNGGRGIQKAYEIAQSNFIEDGNNIVILATDGDFNVGIKTNEELAGFISKKRDTGIYLSILGFGYGNYRFDFAETLAKNGNGNMFYISNQHEIDRLFDGNIAGALEVLAKDVKTQIVFDKNQVDSYRLIGYEHSLMSSEEFEDNKTDAGEILAGDVTVALYEIILNDEVDLNADLFTTEIRYKDPSTNKDQVMSNQNSRYSFTQSENFVFQSLVAEYGMILLDSQYKGTSNYVSIVDDYNEHKNNFLNDAKKEEFIRLVVCTKELTDNINVNNRNY